MEPRKRCLPTVIIYVSRCFEYTDFQTGHFADFKQFKLMGILLTLSKSELTLLIHFLLLWVGHSYVTALGQDVRLRKTMQTLSV